MTEQPEVSEKSLGMYSPYSGKNIKTTVKMGERDT